MMDDSDEIDANNLRRSNATKADHDQEFKCLNSRSHKSGEKAAKQKDLGRKLRVETEASSHPNNMTCTLESSFGQDVLYDQLRQQLQRATKKLQKYKIKIDKIQIQSDHYESMIGQLEERSSQLSVINKNLRQDNEVLQSQVDMLKQHVSEISYSSQQDRIRAQNEIHNLRQEIANSAKLDLSEQESTSASR